MGYIHSTNSFESVHKQESLNNNADSLSATYKMKELEVIPRSNLDLGLRASLDKDIA